MQMSLENPFKGLVPPNAACVLDHALIFTHLSFLKSDRSSNSAD